MLHKKYKKLQLWTTKVVSYEICNMFVAPNGRRYDSFIKSRMQMAVATNKINKKYCKKNQLVIIYKRRLKKTEFFGNVFNLFLFFRKEGKYTK